MLALLIHWWKLHNGRTKNPTLWPTLRICRDATEKTSQQNAFARDKWSAKAKFYYTILVADRSEADGNLQRAGIWPII